MTAKITFERTGAQQLRIIAAIDMHVAGLDEVLSCRAARDNAARVLTSESVQNRGRQDLLTVEEAADILHVCRDKMYQLIRTGQLRSIKIGNSRRISRSWITEFIDRAEARGDLAQAARSGSPGSSATT
jgi:excisionase family DNA binding protein